MKKFWKRRSAAEKKQEEHQKALDQFAQVYGIPAGTPLSEIKKKIQSIPDPNKRRIAGVNFINLVEQLKK